MTSIGAAVPARRDSRRARQSSVLEPARRAAWFASTMEPPSAEGSEKGSWASTISAPAATISPNIRADASMLG